MAAGGNHSTMVKFSSRNNPDYTKALYALYRFEKVAKALVESNFCSGEWPLELVQGRLFNFQD